MQTNNTTKIIIDTDPGIDDAMAIYFALAHPQLELLGLTTIFGNVSTELATANALRLCEIAQIDIPVCHGEDTGLDGTHLPFPDFVHGKDGLGELNLPVAKRSVDPRGAVEFMHETIQNNPGEITLIPIGPLTNIAKLVQQHPDSVAKVKEVILMGGSVFFPGNVTPLAEANSANDPLADNIVFGANWKVTMIGLDVTAKSLVGPEDFKKIASANRLFGEVLEKAADFYINFYSKELSYDGCCMHDVSAVALPVARDLFATRAARIRVVTESFARGMTAVMKDTFVSQDKEWLARPMQNYAHKVDAEGLRKLFVNTLCGQTT